MLLMLVGKKDGTEVKLSCVLPITSELLNRDLL